MNISAEEMLFYQENGYLLLKNKLEHRPLDDLMSTVAHIISLEAGVNESDLPKEEILNKVLIDLKRKNPSSSSWIYQSIQYSWALKKFFIDINITSFVSELLNVNDPKNLGVVSPAFRFDIPGDNRNIRTWHQDGNYFLENSRGEDHLVVWIPMNEAHRDNGTVIIAPGSHKIGKQGANHAKAEGFKSEQYTASEDQYKNYEHVYIEADKGDIAFINMDLLHSSGTNVTTDEVRYTAQIRFNQIDKEDYRPVQIKPEYPVYSRYKK
jgi:hypothetical protein